MLQQGRRWLSVDHFALFQPNEANEFAWCSWERLAGLLLASLHLRLHKETLHSNANYRLERIVAECNKRSQAIRSFSRQNISALLPSLLLQSRPVTVSKQSGCDLRRVQGGSRGPENRPWRQRSGQEGAKTPHGRPSGRKRQKDHHARAEIDGAFRGISARSNRESSRLETGREGQAWSVVRCVG